MKQQMIGQLLLRTIHEKYFSLTEQVDPDNEHATIARQLIDTHPLIASRIGYQGAPPGSSSDV
jgi:hypothetical protein